MDNKYYDGREILSRHYQVNMVCGERAGGKSWWAKMYVLRRSIKDHEKQFALVVRDVQQLEGSTTKTYFDDIMLYRYPDYEITLKKKDYWLKDKRTGEKWCCGHVFALKHAGIIKSSAFPLIETIIFEEFCSVDGKYLNKEFLLFETLMSTLLRGINIKFKQDAKILMIANNYSVNVPYFREWDLFDQITADPYKRFYMNKDKSVILERTDNLSIEKSKFGSEEGNAGKWTDFRNELKLIPKGKVKQAKVLFQMTLDNRDYMNACRYNDGILIFKGDRRIPDVLCYSCSDYMQKDVYNIDFFRTTPRYKELEDLYNTNSLFYDTLNTHINLKNFLEF